MYRATALDKIPWHSEAPPKPLIRAMEKIGRGFALDICCGAGTNSVFLAKNGFEVKGIDISETAIRLAKQRAEAEGIDVDFEVGDVLSLEGEGQYDFVFDRGCFHHSSDNQKAKFTDRINNLLGENGFYQLMAFSERNN